MNHASQISHRKVLILPRKPLFTHLFLLLFLATVASSAFGQTFSTLYNFGATPHDGQAPAAGVIIDPNGNLFGTTGRGAVRDSDGIVFELSPPANAGDLWIETVLHRFRGTPDGKIPLGRLVMNSDGVLFGTTLQGGANDLGTAYRVARGNRPGVWREKPIHDFGTVPDDAVSPNLGLFNAPEGLYGVDQGGANNTGAVYLLTPPAKGSVWTQNILYSFGAFQSGDAAFPSGELVRDASGNFYGVTAQGGVNNLGAVYELSPPAVPGNPWTETVIYSFNFTDGTLPAGRLLLGAHGELYGTASGGGTSQAGLVFQLDPPAVQGNSWTQTILYEFTGSSDGSTPESGVIADSRGRLFGAAADTVFMLRPPRIQGRPWKETMLHTFAGPDGFTVSGPLTLAKKALYGTTSQAGAFGKGTVFQVTIP